MTIEQKIARDLDEVGKFKDLVLSVFGDNKDPFEHMDDKFGYKLRNAVTCLVCSSQLVSPLLCVEIDECLGVNLITQEGANNLKSMISGSGDDLDLARELISNLRTKRLRKQNADRRRV